MAVIFNATTTQGLLVTPDNSGAIQLQANGSNALLIDASQNVSTTQNLIVGGTTTSWTNIKGHILQTNGEITVLHSSASVTGDRYIWFVYNATQIGSISQNGTTAVAYNTSSDYRLKENITPMTGALTKVALLKPVNFKWKSDGSASQGFIAHELAEVCPDAVTGDKDAVGADGKPMYQGVDTSFLVATLTAAIQEQQELIKSLTSRIAALEAK